MGLRNNYFDKLRERVITGELTGKVHGILALPPCAAQLHYKLTRNFKGNFGSAIRPNDGKRKINASCDTR
jgi:hypothetical protein